MTDDNIEKYTACQRHGHHYRLASNPYRKVTGEKRRLFGMKKDKSTVYVMLYCTQCAKTKEIIQIDHRFGLDQIDL